jgi:hypothetical protein
MGVVTDMLSVCVCVRYKFKKEKVVCVKEKGPTFNLSRGVV